jgi:hypothetical protein
VDSVQTFAVLDKNDKIAVIPIKIYYAETNLLHCKDSTGKGHGHRHFQKDFSDPSAADKFWDIVFDHPNKTKRVMGSTASTKRNCHAFALGYDYWIDQGEDPNNKLPYLDAFKADTVAQPKNSVVSNDLLLYHIAGEPFKSHSSVISIANNNKVEQLQWRFNASATYQLNKCTFDTPKYFGDVKIGSKPADLIAAGEEGGWVWKNDGAGAEANLYKEQDTPQARTKKK